MLQHITTESNAYKQKFFCELYTSDLFFRICNLDTMSSLPSPPVKCYAETGQDLFLCVRSNLKFATQDVFFSFLFN